ncbi:hypothetical protein MP228_007735 [Amoeboaphelidium protococcarum]|nr:hypothetical protein MP228_007735 [Amoeboaphelidium protococcarum]
MRVNYFYQRTNTSFYGCNDSINNTADHVTMCHGCKRFGASKPPEQYRVKFASNYPRPHSSEDTGPSGIYYVNPAVMDNNPFTMIKMVSIGYVRRKQRCDSIFTYPYNGLDGYSAYTASSCTDMVQRSLVKVLVILLSRFGDAKRFRKSARSQPAPNSLAVQTPLYKGQSKFLDTVQKVAKKLDFSMVKLKKALTKEPAGSRVVGVPRFIIDYNNDGSPIYQEVRVTPPGIAKEMTETAELDGNQFFESTQYSPSIIDCQQEENECLD